MNLLFRNSSDDSENIRRYTQHNLKKKSFDKLIRRFSVTTWLIILNVVFYVIFSSVLFFKPDFISFIAVQPSNFFQGQVWQLITSMFMHGNLTHLFVNMLSLFFIGNFVEKLIGRKRMFWVYILSGIFAGLFFVGLAYLFGSSVLGAKIFGSSEVFAVGASGAIFGLGGLLAMLTPNLRVYVFFFLPMRMWFAMIFLLGVLWFASIGVGLPFGNTAHLGGLLVGICYGIYLKKKYKRKTQAISKYFSG